MLPLHGIVLGASRAAPVVSRRCRGFLACDARPGTAAVRNAGACNHTYVRSTIRRILREAQKHPTRDYRMRPAEPAPSARKGIVSVLGEITTGWSAGVCPHGLTRELFAMYL